MILSNCLRQRIAYLAALMCAGERIRFSRDGLKYVWQCEGDPREWALFLAHSDQEFQSLSELVECELGIGEKARKAAA